MLAGTAHAKEWRAPEKWRGKWKGEVVVTYVAEENLVAACNAMLRRTYLKNWFMTIPPAYGCANKNFKRTNVCEIIVVNKTVEGYSPAEIVKHETDHCAGWPVDHPDH